MKTTRNPFASALFLSLATLTLIASHEAKGVVYTWTGTTDTNWATAGNWSPTGGPPDANADTALFNATGSGRSNPIVSASTDVGQISFASNATAYTLGGTGQFRINGVGGAGSEGIVLANGSANQIISAAIRIDANQIWNIGGTSTLTVSGIVSENNNNASSAETVGDLVI